MTGFTVVHNWFLDKCLIKDEGFMSSASNITHSEFFGDSRQIVEKILHFLIQGVGYKGQIVSVYKVQIVSLYKVLNSISKKGSPQFVQERCAYKVLNSEILNIFKVLNFHMKYIHIFIWNIF